jgi:hypothetical protein
MRNMLIMGVLDKYYDGHIYYLGVFVVFYYKVTL